MEIVIESPKRKSHSLMEDSSGDEDVEMDDGHPESSPIKPPSNQDDSNIASAKRVIKPPPSDWYDDTEFHVLDLFAHPFLDKHSAENSRAEQE